VLHAVPSSKRETPALITSACVADKRIRVLRRHAHEGCTGYVRMHAIGRHEPSSSSIYAKNYLSALVRLAGQHLVSGSGLGERQDIADAGGQGARVDEGCKFFEVPG
jgi:hypothetical protein